MKRFGNLRIPLRDYIGICELHIIDNEKNKNSKEQERYPLNRLKSAVGLPCANIEFRQIDSNKKKSTFLSTQRRTFTHKISSSRTS